MQRLRYSGIVGSLVQRPLPRPRRHCNGTHPSPLRIGGQSPATSIANEKYKGLGIPLEIVNLSITTYMIAQGIAPSIWAPLADRQGRRTGCAYLSLDIIVPELFRWAQTNGLRVMYTSAPAPSSRLYLMPSHILRLPPGPLMLAQHGMCGSACDIPLPRHRVQTPPSLLPLTQTKGTHLRATI